MSGPHPRRRLTQSKIEKAVKAVASACGNAQVVIEPDGTIRVMPVDAMRPGRFDNGDVVDM